MITKEAATNLAVVYHAFLTTSDENGIMVWGRMLIEAQDETGIELLKTETIEGLMAVAKREAP